MTRLIRAAAMVTGICTIAVFFMMLIPGWPLFSHGHLLALLAGGWNPTSSQFGILPMIVGSTAIAGGALLVGTPLSLGVAFVTVIFARGRMRRILLSCVRLMSGVPTVVYGFVALIYLVPFIRSQFHSGSGFSILTSSLVLGLLISPTMIVLFVNALDGVDPRARRAAATLGATPVQRLLYLQLSEALPGLLSGVVMGLGRAMGDTFISLMLAGNSINMPGGVLESARTLTAHIALVMAVDFHSLEFQSIYLCGFVLYLFTFMLVLILRAVDHRFQRRRVQ